MEQGQVDRSESAVEAQGNPGDPHLPSTDQEIREVAMFNLAIDSKLRGCDLGSVKVRDVTHGNQVSPRASVMQHKTQWPVQFELTNPTREAVGAWIAKAKLKPDFGSAFTIVRNPKDELKTGTFHAMCSQLGIKPNDL